MPLTERLSRAQKIVIVVAFGIALETAGTYLVNLGNETGFGWYAYAPLSQSASPFHTGATGWLRLVIWLLLICLWSLGSIWVLRPSPKEPPHH